MTATIQVDIQTPDIFAKVEKRLAEAIHEEALSRALLADEKNRSIGMISFYGQRVHETSKLVREWRGIHQALKRRLTVNLDAELYWSLTNE